MGDRDKGQWYTNKDLFELINELQIEMRETREAIKKYNGLYDKVATVKKQVDHIESITEGRNKFKEAIRLWGGWLFGLVTLVILIYQTFS